MKILFFIAVACLLSGANAGAFTDTLANFGNGVAGIFKDLAGSLKQPLTDLTNTLVDNLKTAGTQLLATGATSLLGSLSHLGETPQTGTRDLSLLTEAKNFIDQGKQIVGRLSEVLGTLYHRAMSSLTQIAHSISSMDFLKQPLSKTLGDINEVVDIHSILQNGIVKKLTTNPGAFLIDAAKGLIGKLTHKRDALMDNLSGLGQEFIKLFKPVVDAVTHHVQTLGSSLAQTATDLFHSVQPALGQLGQTLLGHMTALKSSTQDLLTQGTDVFKTLQNAV